MRNRVTAESSSDAENTRKGPYLPLQWLLVYHSCSLYADHYVLWCSLCYILAHLTSIYDYKTTSRCLYSGFECSLNLMLQFLHYWGRKRSLESFHSHTLRFLQHVVQLLVWCGSVWNWFDEIWLLLLTRWSWCFGTIVQPSISHKLNSRYRNRSVISFPAGRQCYWVRTSLWNLSEENREIGFLRLMLFITVSVTPSTAHPTSISDPCPIPRFQSTGVVEWRWFRNHSPVSPRCTRNSLRRRTWIQFLASSNASQWSMVSDGPWHHLICPQNKKRVWQTQKCVIRNPFSKRIRKNYDNRQMRTWLARKHALPQILSSPGYDSNLLIPTQTGAWTPFCLKLLEK